MATSGSRDFELDVADIIEEAYERCGIEVRTGYDAKTARRSLNLMFADWANRGLNRWTMKRFTQTFAKDISEYPVGTITLTVSASGSFTIGETITGGTSGATTTTTSTASLEDTQATIDILSGVIRRDDSDISITRVSRDEYLAIATKSTTGRPSQFYVNRQITPVVTVWPVPENSTDQFIYDRLVRIDDADASVNTMEIPFRFYPCLAAGLAYYISLKRAPERIQVLKALYEEEFLRAAEEDRDKANITLVPSYNSLSAVS